MSGASYASSYSAQSPEPQLDDEEASARAAEEEACLGSQDGSDDAVSEDEAYSEFQRGSDGAASEAESASEDGAPEAQSAWAWRLQNAAPPAGLTERDRFLLTAHARTVFTMREWQQQTEELMRM